MYNKAEEVTSMYQYTTLFNITEEMKLMYNIKVV